MRVNGDWCKLTLGTGEQLEHSFFVSTDEGWDRTQQNWRHEGARVTTECREESLDCDGRFDRYWESECKLSELASWPLAAEDGAPEKLPRWREITSGQRDHEAEKAGY